MGGASPHPKCGADHYRRRGFLCCGAIDVESHLLGGVHKAERNDGLKCRHCDVWHFLSDVATLGSLYYLAAFHRSPYV